MSTFDVEETNNMPVNLMLFKFLTLNMHSLEAYLELYQTCKLEFFEKISNGFQPHWFFNLHLNFLLQWSRCYSSYFLDNNIDQHFWWSKLKSSWHDHSTDRLLEKCYKIPRSLHTYIMADFAKDIFTRIWKFLQKSIF